MAFFLFVALALVAACQADAGAPVASAPAAGTRSEMCKSKYAYYKIDSSCDQYVECVDYVAKNQLCPDGMYFNPAAQWPAYPCSYPMDVPCKGSTQKAQETPGCPHQYGYFPAETPSDNCGEYRMCVAGHPFAMSCPTGLAFNPDTSRCDWPEYVPSCSTQKFFGFSCPAVPLDSEGKPLDVELNYKFEGNCFYFFNCEDGHPRLLSCDEGLAFDPVSHRCVDADLVDCSHNPHA